MDCMLFKLLSEVATCYHNGTVLRNVTLGLSSSIPSELPHLKFNKGFLRLLMEDFDSSRVITIGVREQAKASWLHHVYGIHVKGKYRK